ncbi:hypothetical protein HED60_23625 [Planctomycetales bacterium ZRK34]|nr:hypothetical protein HED60_23625 [Planctomycetales bacterium ZRK34]
MNPRTTTRSLLFLAVVLALATAAGCAATPQDRWFQQREALNTANRIYLAHVPVMTDEQIVHHGELLQTARAQLDQAKTQLPEGGSTFDTTLDMVEALLTRVIALEAAPGSVTPVPAVPDPANPNTEDTPNDTR